MFNELIEFWKATRQTYLSGDIGQVMYWYLTLVIVTVAGMYVFLYYQGFVGITIIINEFFLARPSDIPFTLLMGVGVILIIRFGFMSAIDGLKAKPPKNLENRLVAVEQKMDRLYKMAVDPDFDPKKEDGIV